METLDVRIVKLDPMRVLAFHGFGEGPEEIAFGKLEAWMKANGVSLDSEHRIFGFDNPTPAPGSSNYGYDYWIGVDETVQADMDAQVMDFPGGLYAVTRCKVKNAWEDIPSTWQRLVAWRENSKYAQGSHQWLEEHLSLPFEGEGFVLDLFLPVRE